ncbi:hypothetical protein [Paraburkholderia antibiotica]|uniref:Uncharacterized protein n=1 Tax=Paraburkholderia antibiotica TaxID=2728839 RepID=A0A7X9X1V1_9BURK|nr:hypothetical protein [Paraburkholderia antibiotica]NML29821.1 hypothetical protein [Paraburkholderia antibiotica]
MKALRFNDTHCVKRLPKPLTRIRLPWLLNVPQQFVVYIEFMMTGFFGGRIVAISLYPACIDRLAGKNNFPKA